MSNRVTHFEIPSDDPEANMKFFGDVFGWTFRQDGDRPYWFAISGDESTPGINGAVMKKRVEGQPLVNSIVVEDIDETCTNIEKAGGRVVIPKWEIPDYGYIAFFADPDGNMHGIAQQFELKNYDIMKNPPNIFNEIDEVLTNVISLLSEFTQDEINTVPFTGSWTPGELAQHIVITTGGVIEQLSGPVTDTDRPFDKHIRMLKDMFLNFEIKYESPASARPESKDYNKEDLLHKLHAFKDYFNHYNQAIDLTLTCVAFEFPGEIGYLTRMENLHFMLYHTQRHLHQLKNMYNSLITAK